MGSTWIELATIEHTRQDWDVPGAYDATAALALFTEDLRAEFPQARVTVHDGARLFPEEWLRVSDDLDGDDVAETIARLWRELDWQSLPWDANG